MPYIFLLFFPDASVEVCYATAFAIDYVTIIVQAQSCEPDVIFANGFE